jgi:mono/diheme cytochrome c family protein
MAATDQFYRPTKTLNIVFAVSCVFMLVSLVWMMADDYHREFRDVQREFRDVDEAVTARTMLDKMPEAEKVREAATKVDELRKKLVDIKRENNSALRDLLTDKAKQEARYRNIKADLDSYKSLRDIAADNRDENTDPGLDKTLDNEVQTWIAKVEQKDRELIQAQKELDQTDAELKKRQRAQDEAAQEVSKAEDELKKISGDFDRFAKAAAQKRWKIGDTVRNLPILDAFASPTRIQQYTLAEYPIDYNFKYVTRYDRCTTCHLGMERPALARAALEKLVDEKASEESQHKLDEARTLLLERAQEAKKVGADLGWDPKDLPRTMRNVNLTKSQITQYCAHPRLDLFVDGNSPHPAEKFGCTSCHDGQGSATDFVNAVHMPNSSTQAQEWREGKYGWERNEFWDYPMLPRRFVESTCVKCHHQITDLIHNGNQIEAPKLIRGYDLVRDSGCFGCHEIAGMKDGKEIGPDMRLEMSPPLEAYSPSERAKLLSDPANPPGTMRKVGPSLYRISEKTNEHWARRWIEGPRNFRPTTKMPHFYGLSNNRPETLPGEQQEFPSAEITSIAYYLFKESADYLEGKNKYSGFMRDRVKELEQKKKDGLASENEIRQLAELQVRLEQDRHVVPLGKEVRNWEGNAVTLPAVPQDQKAKEEQLVRGRRLFSERGCLACHVHEATTKAEGVFAAITSDAEFGPDLSRIAAKISPENGDPEAKRRWLIQWLLDPHVHHPRSFMPVLYLEVGQAADIAAWLLAQPAEGWDAAPDIAAPKSDVLAALARVYLLKSPGMTYHEADEILESVEGNTRKGILPEMLTGIAADADERELAAPLDDNKLKWYIGRKAISRLGCFGCHEIPGFAASKPVGTPLNDWGKKDPARLAFEDIVAFVKENYHIVDSMTDEQGNGLSTENGKPAYEKFFFDSLEHQQRQGFLNQKLIETRSYDYHRMRSWDDRLRMPQFKFARGHIKPHEGETPEQADAREEAEAREAVMTFILGLVAEPVPSKYLNDPAADKLAEAKGRKVLEKYNCIGCHQVRPGYYELTRTPEVLSKLEDLYQFASHGQEFETDYHTPEFLADNAWEGVGSAQSDRIPFYGIPSPKPEGTEAGTEFVRLTHALRFTDANRQVRDVPAGNSLSYTATDLLARAEPLGGTFGNLIVQSKYLTRLNPQKYTLTPRGDSSDARAALPPPLTREGEKVQPGWLFQFLRNPFVIRPTVVLRMPRFNMSDEEAMDLVNYFAAADKVSNPGIGLHYPYINPFPQRQEAYWDAESQRYVSRLKEQNLLQSRLTELQPLWELLRNQQLASVELALKEAKEAEAQEKDKDKKKGEADNVKALEAHLAALRNRDAFIQSEQKQWEEHGAYASDGFRLLASYDRCLNCHQVGALAPKQPIGPPLDLAAERLRPDWLLRWIGNPQRLLIYPDGSNPMPQNFPSKQIGNMTQAMDFAGTPLEQVTAVRDVLIDYPKVSSMPANRMYRPQAGGIK